MRKKKLTADEKGMKVNEQRFALIIMLTNILDTEKGISNQIKSAISASLINMMGSSFIPEDDEPLANLINNSIDRFCKKIEYENGIEDYRSELETQVKNAKKIAKALKKELEEKARRIMEGEEILKGICLN